MLVTRKVSVCMLKTAHCLSCPALLCTIKQVVDMADLCIFNETVLGHKLENLLLQVVGLDMVDDESRPERRPAKHMQTPAEWNLKHNPAYSYYAYYVYANLFTLNKLREARGLNTIAFRPHAGRQPFGI